MTLSLLKTNPKTRATFPRVFSHPPDLPFSTSDHERRAKENPIDSYGVGNEAAMAPTSHLSRSAAPIHCAFVGPFKFASPWGSTPHSLTPAKRRLNRDAFGSVRLLEDEIREAGLPVLGEPFLDARSGAAGGGSGSRDSAKRAVGAPLIMEVAGFGPTSDSVFGFRSSFGSYGVYFVPTEGDLPC